MPVRAEAALLGASPGESAAQSWRRRVDQLCRAHQSRWESASERLPEIGVATGWLTRVSNARAARRLIDQVAGRLEVAPESESEITLWRQELRQLLQRFGERRLGWPAGYRRLVFADDFYDVSVEFVREARRFDPDIAMAEVGQALRNVWIVNSLQMLFGSEVALSPPVLAYSLLYPYTDNLLDDPAISRAAKVGFNRRLGARLAGETVAPHSSREGRVFELIKIIERSFPRTEYADVHESLLAIHRAQVESLRLQGGSDLHPDKAVLATQVEKGGTSVLADGYLMWGSLTPEQEEFCFGYGVFLQLLDDLQDAGPDLAAGHATLFTEHARRGPLDQLTSRLYNYMVDVLDEAPCLAGPELADRKDLILRNCTVLMVGAVSESPSSFGRGFRRYLQARWPLGLGALRRLRRRGLRVFERARKRLERRRGVESLWDLLT